MDASQSISSTDPIAPKADQRHQGDLYKLQINKLTQIKHINNGNCGIEKNFDQKLEYEHKMFRIKDKGHALSQLLTFSLDVSVKNFFTY